MTNSFHFVVVVCRGDVVVVGGGVVIVVVVYVLISLVISDASTLCAMSAPFSPYNSQELKSLFSAFPRPLVLWINFQSNKHDKSIFIFLI